MNKDYDKILKHALTPDKEPSFWLNQNILRQMEETGKMKKRTYRRYPAVALALALTIGVSSMTAYAAWKYLYPEQVAVEMQDEKLADAFQGEDAIDVNETQCYGGYKVTFLGMVSGELLTDYVSMSDGEIQADRSHMVVAIEKADGTVMPDTKDDAYGQEQFFVSPFIKGYHPGLYNAYSLSGGYTDIVEDGVLYRIMECNNVEMFADKGIYLAVQDGLFYQENAYIYDEATGEIVRNDSYEGLNALFQVPVDISKADPEAAAVYMETLFSGEETALEDNMVEAVGDEETQVNEWFEEVIDGNLEELTERVESTVQVLTPDADGYLLCKAYEVEGRGGAPEQRIATAWATPSDEVGKIEVYLCSSSGTFDTVLIHTFTKNADGTYTFAAYIPKNVY